jgi:hypothetical protein
MKKESSITITFTGRIEDDPVELHTVKHLSMQLKKSSR